MRIRTTAKPGKMEKVLIYLKTSSVKNLRVWAEVLSRLLTILHYRASEALMQ